MTIGLLWLGGMVLAGLGLAGVWIIAITIAARRPRGWVATPKGVLPGPSDHALRQARKFYARRQDGILPMYSDLALIEAECATLVPRPVPEGAVVTLVERTAGGFKVRVDLVVPRPQNDGGEYPTREAAEAVAPFQYVGTPVDPPQPWRVQFDHAMIWAMDRPVPQPRSVADGPSQES